MRGALSKTLIWKVVVIVVCYGCRSDTVCTGLETGWVKHPLRTVTLWLYNQGQRSRILPNKTRHS
jgi:hypothetical protein